MFTGYTEPVSKIAARKARIVAKDPEAAPVVKIIPPMTREAWEAMPIVFRYFHKWEQASQPLTVRIG